MLEAKNAMYVSTGALVEAGDVSMASGSYPSPLLDAKGNKLATFWKVTAAGVSSDGVDYQVGDTLVYSVATNSYYKIDNTESVTSVNGKKGAVTLTHADVGALAATANAVAALKLATARSIAFTGGASGSGQFDGTQNLSIALTIADDGHKHTFANLKGLPNTLAGYGIIDAASSSHGHSDLLSKAGGAMSGAMTINIASAPTIAGANFANGWLQVGTSSMGIAIDSNEIFNVGTDLIIGTLTAGTGIQFKPGGGTGSAAGEVKADGLYSAGSKVLTAASGNAVSASKLAAAASITIGSTTKTFDGSAPLSFSISEIGALAASANAVSASKWATARTIALSGGATGSATIDGSANVSIAVTVPPTGHVHALREISDSPYKEAVDAATVAALTVTATSTTLTNAGTQAAIVIDGVTLAAGMRLLVKDQAAPAQNGIYVVTNIGSASTNWVLTRSSDADTAAKIAGAVVTVDSGTVNGAGLFTNDFKKSSTIGTTAMNWRSVVDNGNIGSLHHSSGVAAGTYRSVSVNAQGHVTGGSNPTTLAGYGITDAAALSHAHAIAGITGLQSALDSKINVGSAPTKGSTGATGNGVTYTRLASLPANIGSGSCSLHLLVTGGSNFGGNHVPLFSVAFSTRGYSGSGAHTAGMIRAVSLNNSPSSVTFYAVTNATTSRVELWMRRESYSHTVDVTVVNSNGGQLHVDGTTATAPTGDVTEFAPVTLYHSNNKPTLAELGAMSAAGGEMLGSLTLGTNDLIFKGADTGDIVFANADGSQRGRFWHTGSGLMFSSTSSTSATAAGSMQLTSAGLMIAGNLVYHAGNKPTVSDIGAVAKSGDTMTGPLSINVDSASTRFLSAVNETDGWTWIQMGKSATANQGHFSWNTQSYEGHPANAFHFRPTGGPTVMSAAKGVVTIYKDAVLNFQGNSTWGGKLSVGGNGRTASNDGLTASVVTTNGNLHLDGASGDRGVYLSFYAGSAGVKFGNGAGSVVGSVDNAGNMSMNGTITAPTFSGNLAGNADSATSATYLRNVGNVAPESGATRGPESVLQLRNVYNNGYPTTYGTLLHLGGGGQGQILIGWPGSSGASVPVYVRSKRDTSDASWSEWQQLYSTLHKPTPADIGAMADGGTYGTVTFNNWIRTTGQTGWYNASYGGGMYMTDSTWVRTSHQKKFYVENTGFDAIYTAGGIKAESGITIGNVSTGRKGIQGLIADNDYWAIFGAADATNAGRLIIGTGDDGTEPIAVAQYSGAPLTGTPVRTAYLLDGSGNTSFPGVVSAGKFAAVGNGNDYGSGAFEAKGNGTTNTVFPTYGFHQPGLYAGSLQMKTAVDFYFYQQGGTALANVSANTFNGYLNGTAAVATYLNSGASSTGVTSIASRVNSGFYECSAPTTANGWPVTGSWYHMIASTHSNAGNYYSMQFAADFYNSNNLFFRCTNGNGATGWNRVWHSGNFNPDTKMGDGGTYGTLYLNNWFRSNGATGWYNQTYGGGIYMTDSTWIRTYGGKLFYVDSTAYNAINTAGGITASGTIYGADFSLSSDIRLKSNLQPILGALGKLMTITPYTYDKAVGKDFKQTKREAGLIAQELEKILPESVSVGDDGYLRLSPSSVIALLVGGIQELAKRVGVIENMLEA